MNDVADLAQVGDHYMGCLCVAATCKDRSLMEESLNAWVIDTSEVAVDVVHHQEVDICHRDSSCPFVQTYSKCQELFEWESTDQ